jgi:hypothetical protein
VRDFDVVRRVVYEQNPLPVGRQGEPEQFIRRHMCVVGELLAGTVAISRHSPSEVGSRTCHNSQMVSILDLQKLRASTFHESKHSGPVSLDELRNVAPTRFVTYALAI